MRFKDAHALRAILFFCLLAATAGCGPSSKTAVGASDASHNPDAAADGNAAEPASQPQRDSVTLNWTPPLENSDGSTLQDLAGYKIYSGRTREDLTLRVTLKNPGLMRYVVEPLAPGELHFAIAAFNSKGAESTLSAVASAAPN